LVWLTQPTKKAIIMKTNHYVNHNRRILLSTIAKEQHQAWLKERDERALKRAKQDVAPTKGKIFHSMYELRQLLGWKMS
jgi:hypothetical protein